MLKRFYIALIALASAYYWFVDAALSADSAPVSTVKLTGGDEASPGVSVQLINGKWRVATDAVTTVEQVFGQDPQGTSYFFFGATLEDADGIGAAGDTVQVQIPAGVTPLGAIYPAVDVTYTIVAGDVSSSNPERTVALNVCTALNGDSDFQDAEWKCTVAKDFALVHIESRLFNEFGTRTTWTVTCSGTTVCNLGFSDIARRGKPTELSRSPNDPRQGILAIAGSVTTIPGAISDRFFQRAENSLSSSEITIDCNPFVAGTCEFEVMAIADSRIEVEYISCYGGGNGIKFGQFLSKSGSGLTNGIEIEIRSEGQIFTFPRMKITEDWKNLFATQAGTDFRIDVQAGADQFIAQFRPTVPFPLEPAGTIPSGDDYIRITLEDDISSGINSLECSVFGFEEEP